MAIFEEVKLIWQGQEYVIPADNMLRLIARLEDVLAIGDFVKAEASGKIPFAKVAICYGMALRHAGAKVTDEEVYRGMFGAGGGDLMRLGRTSYYMLMGLMVPPESLRSGGVDPGKGVGAEANAGASSPSATGSSSEAKQ